MIGDPQARIISATKRLLGRTVLRRFVRQQDGAVAVEFGFVALPFLALMLAILQTGLVFFAQESLETVAADSARLIMTGQAQTQNFDRDKFKKAVCDRVAGLFDCMSGLNVDVQTFDSFANLAIGQATPIALDADGKIDPNKLGYQTGGPGDIVVVRLIYLWPLPITVPGLDLSNVSGNKRLMMATVAFRNEPYEADGT
jgi:Flp pilus assembly protein TadG